MGPGAWHRSDSVAVQLTPPLVILVRSKSALTAMLSSASSWERAGAT